VGRLGKLGPTPRPSGHLARFGPGGREENPISTAPSERMLGFWIIFWPANPTDLPTYFWGPVKDVWTPTHIGRSDVPLGGTIKSVN